MSTNITSAQAAAAPIRQARYWSPEIEMRTDEAGVIYVKQTGELGEYPERLADRLCHWAKVDPDRLFLAARGTNDAWVKLTYGQALESARRLGEALTGYNLSPEHPLLILSGNDLEHAQLALACYYSGIPYAPLSPAYSLVSKDFSKLKDIVALLEPGLVFAADGEKFGSAIAAAVSKETPKLVSCNVSGENTKLFAELLETEPTSAIDAAFEAVGPDTIAKFLFTSGSTGSPKGVINTNRMLCANQAMVVDCYAFMADEPPIVLDWAPWNHTAGGNKVFNMVLYNGGTLYIDDGNPTPKGMAKTVRNLKEIAPTWYFNVPRGYEELVPLFKADAELRHNFFSRVKMLMYAGAGLAQHTLDELQRLAVESTGERVLVAAGLGSTETAPFALMCTWDEGVASNVGVPSKGIELKLVPVDDKLEARLKAPTITPGYWKEPKLTADAFDEDGFYNLGDALKFADPDDASRGFLFDGRTAENFKLRTGTWVGVGSLRAGLINHFVGLIKDAVITGLNEEYIGALVLPNWAACRTLTGDETLDDAQVAANQKLRAAMKDKLIAFGKQSTGSSTRVRRMILLVEPPSIDLGEITDKGSLNQRAVLRHRPEKVAELYAGSAAVIDDKEEH